MATPANVKILVCGDVCGHLKTLFSRVESINNKSGPFSMLLCVGDFFGDAQHDDDWDKVRNGIIRVPLPVYILGPNKQEHCKLYPDLKGCPMALDITYLGKRGVLTTSSKLKIAYLSGCGESASKGDVVALTQDDVRSIDVMTSAKDDDEKQGIDILLTSQWPHGVAKHAAAPNDKDDSIPDSLLVSQLAFKLRPRYHFAALNGSYYERLPYRNHQVLNESQRNVTRFISLARVGNALKRKWIYALSIVPVCEMATADLHRQPPDVTECPYTAHEQGDTARKQDAPKQYFFSESNHDDRGDGNRRGGRGRGRGRGGKRASDDRGERGDWEERKRRKHQQQPQPTGPCWFCLASPDVEKHLVISIGDLSYMALAKGGLTDDHVMILPIGHHQSATASPDDVMHEIGRFKDALIKYFDVRHKGVVFFERNYKTQHLQIQAIPVPLDRIARLVDEFQSSCEDQGFDIVEIPRNSDLRQIVRHDASYFYVELPTGEKLLCRISGYFPLNLGREVLAGKSVLGVPEKSDWRQCQLSKDEEQRFVAEFKRSFQPHDFTLQVSDDDDDESDVGSGGGADQEDD